VMNLTRHTAFINLMMTELIVGIYGIL